MAVIKGSAYWTKIFGEPVEGYDPSEKEWTIDVTVDDNARDVLTQLGLEGKINSPTHKRNGDERPKPHDSGEDYITFVRKGVKQDGEPAKPIRVIDKHRRDWNPEDKLGNGTVVAVSFAVNEGEYRGKPWRKPGILGVMVLDHVPYESDDFDQFIDSPADEFDDA